MENKLQGVISPDPTVKAEVRQAKAVSIETKNLEAIISPDPKLKIEVFDKDGNLIDERRKG